MRHQHYDWQKQLRPSPRNASSSRRNTYVYTEPDPGLSQPYAHRSQADFGYSAQLEDTSAAKKGNLRRGAGTEVPVMGKKITKTIEELEAELAKTRQKLKEQKAFKDTTPVQKRTPVTELYSGSYGKEYRPERGRSAEPDRGDYLGRTRKEESPKEVPLSYSLAVHRSEENLVTALRRNGLVVAPKLREEISRVFETLGETIKNLSSVHTSKDYRPRLFDHPEIDDTYQRTSKQLRDDLSKIQQALAISTRIINIELEKLDIDLDHIKSGLKLQQKYNERTTVEEPTYYNRSSKKARSSSQAPREEESNEMLRRVSDMQNEYKKLTEEIRKKDAHIKEWEQVSDKKDMLAQKLLQNARREEAGDFRQRAQSEEVSKKEELIKKLQVELDTAEYLLKRKKDEEAKQTEKDKKAEVALSALCDLTEKFLLAMQRLQRAVSKQDSEAIHKLKEEFEQRRRELNEFTETAKQYYSSSQSHKSPGKIMSILRQKPGGTEMLAATAPDFYPKEQRAEDMLNRSLTKYKVRPVQQPETPQVRQLEQRVQELELEKAGSSQKLAEYVSLVERQSRELLAHQQCQIKVQEYMDLIKEQTEGMKELKETKVRLEEEYVRVSEENRKLEEENRHKQLLLDQKLREADSLNEVFERMTEETRLKDNEIAEKEKLIKQLTNEMEARMYEQSSTVDKESFKEVITKLSSANEEQMITIMSKLKESEDRIASLEGVLDKAKAACATLHNDKAALRKQVLASEQALAKLRSVLNKTQTEKAAISQRLYDSETNYKNEMVEKDRQIDSLQQELSRGPAEEDMGLRVQELEIRLQQKEEEINVSLQNMLQLQTDMENMRQYLEARDAEYTEQCEKLQSLIEEKRTSEPQTNEEEVQQELQHAQAEIEELKSHIETKEAEISQLQETNADLENRNTSLSKAVEDAQNQVQELAKDSSAEAAGEIETLRKQLEDRNSEYETLANNVFTQQQDIAARVQEAVVKAAEPTEAYSQMLETLNVLEGRLSEIAEKVNIVSVRQQALLAKCADADKNASAGLEKLQQEKEKYLNIIAHLKKKNLAVVNKLRELANVKPMKTFVAEVSKTLRTMAAEASEQLRERTKKAAKMIREVSVRLAASERKVEELGKETTQKMHKSVELKFSDLESKNKDLEEQCEAQKDTMKKQWESILQSEEKLGNKERECAALKGKMAKGETVNKVQAQRIKNCLMGFLSYAEQMQTTMNAKSAELEKRFLTVEKLPTAFENVLAKVIEERDQEKTSMSENVNVYEEKISVYESQMESLSGQNKELSETMKTASDLLLSALGIDGAEEMDLLNIVDVVGERLRTLTAGSEEGSLKIAHAKDALKEGVANLQAKHAKFFEDTNNSLDQANQRTEHVAELVAELQEQLVKCWNRIGEVTMEISVWKEECETLKQKADDLEREGKDAVAERDKEISSKDAEIAALTEQLGKREQELAGSADELKEQLAKISAENDAGRNVMISMMKQSDREISSESLPDLCTMTCNLVGELKSALDAETANSKEKSATLEKRGKELQTLKAKAKSLISKTSQSLYELYKKKLSEIEEAKGKMEKLSSLEDAVESIRKAVRGKYRRLKREAYEKEAVLSKEKGNYSEIISKIQTDAENSLRVAEEENKKALDKLKTEQKSETDKLKASFSVLESEAQKVAETLRRLLKSEGDGEAMEGLLARLEEMIEEDRENVAQLKASMGQLADENGTLKAEMAKLKKSVEDGKEKLAKMVEKNMDISEQARGLEEKNQELLKGLEETKGNNVTLAGAADVANKRNAELLADVQKAVQENARLEGAVAEAEAKNKEFAANLGEEQKKRAQAEEERKELARKLEEEGKKAEDATAKAGEKILELTKSLETEKKRADDAEEGGMTRLAETMEESKKLKEEVDKRLDEAEKENKKLADAVAAAEGKNKELEKTISAITEENGRLAKADEDSKELANKLAQAESENQKLVESSGQTAAENMHLRESLKTAEEENKKLAQKLEETEGRSTKLSEDISRIMQEREKLGGVENELLEKLHKTEEEKKTADEELAKFEADNRDLADKLDEANSRVAELSAKHTDASNKLTELEKASKSREQELMKERSKLEEDLKAKAEENKKLEEDLEAKVEENKKLDDDVKAKTEENNKLKDDVDAKTAENKKLEDDIKAKAELCAKLEEDFHAKVEENKKLEDDFKEKAEQCAKLEDDVNAKTEQCKKLEEDFKTKAEQCTKLEEDFKAKAEQCAKLEDDVKAKTEQYKKLDEDFKTKTEESKKLALDIGDLNEKLGKTSEDNLSLSEEIQSLKTELEKARQEAKDANTRAKDALEEFNASQQYNKDEITSLTTQNEELNKRIDELTQQNKLSAEREEKAMEENKKLAERLQSVTATSDTTASVIDKLTKENQDLSQFKSENAKLSTQLENSAAEFQKLKEDSSEEKKALKECISKYNEDVSNFKSEIAKYKTMEKEFADLKQETEVMRQELEKKTRDEVANEDEITRLTKENDDLTKERQSILAQTEALVSKIQAYEKDISELKNKEAESAGKTEPMQKKLETQAEESAKLAAEIANLKTALQEKDQKHENEKAEIQKSMNVMLEGIKAKLAAEGIANENVASGIDELIEWYKNEFGQLEKEKEDTDAGLVEVRAKLLKLIGNESPDSEHENIPLEQLISILEGKVQSLKESLTKETEKKTDDRESQEQALKDTIQKLQQSLASKDEEIKTVKASEESTMMSFSEKMSKLVDENDSLSVELDDIKSDSLELLEKFPPGDHEQYIYELMKILKFQESKIQEIKKQRTAMIGRKSLGTKK